MDELFDFSPGSGDLPTRSAAFEAERPFLFDDLSPRFGVRIVRSVQVPMRDGVELSTDFHLPAGAPLPLPVVLIRTPYDKYASNPALQHIFPEQGFVLAIQDARGRYESGGVFVAGTGQDREDGWDMVSWLAAQSWCNGRIGAMGSSYVGETTGKLAATGHPNYHASILLFDGAYADEQVYNGAFCQAGVTMLRGLFEWFRDYVPRVSYGPPVGIDRAQWFRSSASRLYRSQPEQPPINLDAALRTLPVAEALDRTGAAPSEFARYMRENADPGSSYWERQGFLTRTDQFATPALHITGNEEVGGSGARCFRLFRENASTQLARDNQYLLFAAAPHSGHPRASEHTTRGLRDFGDTRFPYYRTFVDWFGRWLRDDDAGVEGWPRARFFVTGRNEWETADSYPPVDAEPRRLYLGPEGTLGLDPPAAGAAPSTFIYDPADPTPSDLPGAGSELIGIGFADRSPLSARADVLGYASPPLAEPLEIAGAIEVALHVSSDAPDTDFVAVLLEIDGAGRAINVTHGVVRMRWRAGFDRPRFMEPGETYAVRLDLWFANIRFAAGSRIGLHIASSHFPYFDRNLNTGADNYTTMGTRVASNSVHHDRGHPSFVLLPVRHGAPIRFAEAMASGERTIP